MSSRVAWTRSQLLVAFNLYCQIPFGKLHSRNPEIIKYAERIGRTPSALAMKLSNIASLDPVIKSSGRSGLSGASAADREMWNEMQSSWEKFATETYQAMKGLDLPEEQSASQDALQIPDEKTDYTGGTTLVKSKARIGQGFFRKAVLSAYDYRCCITGLSVPRLLAASHIVPWRVDKQNRLNPRNGLSLSMLHDKAFDIGLITIREDMTVQISVKTLVKADAFYTSALLGFDGKEVLTPDKFQPHAEFLDYHRKNVFECLDDQK